MGSQAVEAEAEVLEVEAVVEVGSNGEKKARQNMSSKQEPFYMPSSLKCFASPPSRTKYHILTRPYIYSRALKQGTGLLPPFK